MLVFILTQSEVDIGRHFRAGAFDFGNGLFHLFDGSNAVIDGGFHCLNLFGICLIAFDTGFTLFSNQRGGIVERSVCRFHSASDGFTLLRNGLLQLNQSRIRVLNLLQRVIDLVQRARDFIFEVVLGLLKFSTGVFQFAVQIGNGLIKLFQAFFHLFVDGVDRILRGFRVDFLQQLLSQLGRGDLSGKEREDVSCHRFRTQIGVRRT